MILFKFSNSIFFWCSVKVVGRIQLGALTGFSLLKVNENKKRLKKERRKFIQIKSFRLQLRQSFLNRIEGKLALKKFEFGERENKLLEKQLERRDENIFRVDTFPL